MLVLHRHPTDCISNESQGITEGSIKVKYRIFFVFLEMGRAATSVTYPDVASPDQPAFCLCRERLPAGQDGLIRERSWLPTPSLTHSECP